MSNDKIIERYCKLSLRRQKSIDLSLLYNDGPDWPSGLDYNNDNQEKDIFVDNFNNDLFSENQNHEKNEENDLYLKIVKTFKIENKDEQIDELNSDERYYISKQIEKNSNKKKILGRKRKKEKKEGNQDANHTKENDDNIINKIKSYFFKYVNDTLNEALTKECHYKFIRLPKKKVIESKKDDNIKLLNTPLIELYEDTKKIGKSQRRDYSKNGKILEYLKKHQEQEKKAIDLLNKKVSLILKHFRETNMQQFLDKIRSKYKEEEDQGNVETYLKNVEKLCYGFKDYFENKISKTKKNKKI